MAEFKKLNNASNIFFFAKEVQKVEHSRQAGGNKNEERKST